MFLTLIGLVMLSACGDKPGGADDSGVGGDGGAVTAVDVDADGFASDIDCDDTNPAINPAAAELCDGVDNDCDGSVDEGLTGAYYVDEDEDGYGDPTSIVEACEQTRGLADNPDDCDDSNLLVHPAADELCNGIDDDCDLEVDEADAKDAATWYRDQDEDGYGDAADVVVSCEAPEGYIDRASDCDDLVATTHPEADELCNGVDDDCDLHVDVDAVDAPTWYRDHDGDGYGIDDTTAVQCESPAGFADTNGDCSDYDAEVHPGADEICDGIDNDCEAATSEDGVVTYVSVDGSVSDMTSYFSSGTYSSPTGWILSTDGTFTFCSGTYYTSLALQGDVSLVGLNGPDETILSAGDVSSVVEIRRDGVVASIQGMTLRDGLGSGLYGGSHSYATGGGVYCGANSSLDLVDDVIEDSQADVGGGLYVETCQVDLRGTEIQSNTADYGGAIGVIDAEITLHDTSLHDNSATWSGGAMYIDGSSGVTTLTTLISSLLHDNDAVYGGGVAVFSAGLSCTGSSSTTDGMLSNFASYGGAAFIDQVLTFRSTVCDWGTGSTDNNPEDIYINGATSSDFDNDASFTCGVYTCSAS